MEISRAKLEKYLNHIQDAVETRNSKTNTEATPEEQVRHCSEMAALTGQVVLISKLLNGVFS